MMTGVAIGETSPAQIKHAIKCSDELMYLQNLVKQIVNPAPDGLNRVVVSDLRAQESAKAGHDYRSGNAFAYDIGNDDAEVALYDRDEIIVVATDVSRRHIHAGDVQAWQLWRGSRQQAKLHFVSDAQLFIEPFLFQ